MKLSNQPTSQYFVRDKDGAYQVLSPDDVLEAAKSLLQVKFKRGMQIKNSACVKEYLRVQLAPLEHEVFYAGLLPTT